MTRQTDAMYAVHVEMIESLEEAIRTAAIRARSTGLPYVICAMPNDWPGFRVVSELQYRRWDIATPILERFRPLSHYEQKVSA
ncbi:hypothetical protein [Phytohalomonas tamaricis]|uniref:hypothetical protein n=1 Tax=Phytohalomonas tamaricis TaxID=2081032 RepID=UPI000D0B0C3B|nr:hypothetical protein [Phytohalomonas tamaricis]